MKKSVVALVAVAALSGCASSSESTETTQFVDSTTISPTTKVKSFALTLTVGDNTGADVVIDVEQDTQVVLTFVNPTSHDEIHLHGYDLTTGTMEKGAESVLSFQANKSGEFEIESHETGELLATLKVSAA